MINTKTHKKYWDFEKLTFKLNYNGNAGQYVFAWDSTVSEPAGKAPKLVNWLCNFNNINYTTLKTYL